VTIRVESNHKDNIFDEKNISIIPNKPLTIGKSKRIIDYRG